MRPSICGTAATLTADRFTYYRISESLPYLFRTSGDLLQEEDVDGVHLGEVRFALLCEEIEHVPLRGDFLHELVDVDLLKSWCGLLLCHDVVIVNECCFKFDYCTLVKWPSFYLLECYQKECRQQG